MKGQQGTFLPSLLPGCPPSFLMMPPGKFQRFQSETLVFTVPAGGRGPSPGQKCRKGWVKCVCLCVCARERVRVCPGSPPCEITTENKSPGLPNRPTANLSGQRTPFGLCLQTFRWRHLAAWESCAGVTVTPADAKGSWALGMSPKPFFRRQALFAAAGLAR